MAKREIEVFSAEVQPVRYGLDRDTGITLDVIEVPASKRHGTGVGAGFDLGCGDWGLAVTIRGDELLALHAHLGRIIERGGE